VLQSERFAGESIPHGETGIVVVVSNNGQPSFLSVSPSSPLPASFYRAGRGIASAKIAAALHIRATLMRRGIGRSRPCRFLVTSKLQAIVRRKSGGSDVSEPRQDYGRRNIANGAMARASASAALACKSRKVVGATVAITSNSAIDLGKAGGCDDEEEEEAIP